VLTAVATGVAVSTEAVGATLGKLGIFLFLLLAAGILTVPRAVRWVRRLESPETLLVLALGLCFGVSYLALAFGYSVALGAFIAGSLVGESGEAHEVERLVRPVRDLFAAIFFVSVGTLIDPALVREHWVAVVAFTLLVALGKSAAVAFGAFLTGNGVRTSVQTGMSLAQIGEFSFIIAALGTSLGATGGHLYPIAVAVSAVTTLSTPWLIRLSGPVAELVDRKLPRSFQTVVSLYGSWIEQLRKAPDRRTVGTRVRRIARVLALDAVLLGGVVIASAVLVDRAAPWVGARLKVGESFARGAFIACAVIASVPFVAGLARNTRRLGLALAESALPPGSTGRPDLAAAPRRMLVATLQLGSAVMILLPIVAITQPFLPGTPGAAVLAGVLVVLGIGFWRSAANLQGHVRAGAQVIAEALAKQTGSGGAKRRDALVEFRAMFPGMGDPVTVRLTPDAIAVGRTLSSLSLRGVTGATVLAIARPNGAVMIPSASEVLRPGDVLALAGTQEAVAAAQALLTRSRSSREPVQSPV
jgi:CPA2 family monovalent cation:H+ antiporter-2